MNIAMQIQKEMKSAQKQVEELFEVADSDEENNRKVIDFWYQKFNSALHEKYDAAAETQRLKIELEN